MSLLPVWRWRDRIFSAGSIDEVVVAAAFLGVLVVVLLPRRYLLMLPLALFVYYAAATRPVEAIIYRASHGAWEAGARPIPDWVDRAVGSDAGVAQVWTGGGDQFAFWESEFYNRSVGPVYALSRPYDGFGQRMATILPSGRVDYLRRPLSLRYALTDRWTDLRGEVTAKNPLTGMVVYRINGPLVVTDHIQGLYPDLWTGPVATYRRYACDGGSLVLDVETNPILHPRPFFVTVLQHGVETDRLRVAKVPRRQRLVVPLRSRDGFCDAVFQVPTGSARLATPGDLRELGLRVLERRYLPPR
jgi:hypothetical protein